MRYCVLALDLATTTGWALYSSEMERPFWGTFRLPRTNGQSIGPALEALRQFLADQHRMHTLTDVVYEAQHISDRININTAELLISLGGFTQWWATRCDVRHYKAMIAEWRKHFLGRGSGFKAAGLPDAKELSIRRCADFGWAIDKPDAAEAVGILDFHLNFIEQADRSFKRPWRDRTLMGGGRG